MGCVVGPRRGPRERGGFMPHATHLFEARTMGLPDFAPFGAVVAAGHQPSTTSIPRNIRQQHEGVAKDYKLRIFLNNLIISNFHWLVCQDIKNEKNQINP